MTYEDKIKKGKYIIGPYGSGLFNEIIEQEFSEEESRGEINRTIEPDGKVSLSTIVLKNLWNEVSF